ncbi:MAG TPA: hypothetical protein VF278_00345 [Pirellulales bacterium]
MSEHTPDAGSPSAQSLARGHELADVQSGSLLLSAVILAVGVAVVCVLLTWFLRSLRTDAKRHDPTLSPLYDRQWRPEGPRLQTDPAGDLARMRDRENRALHGYRWIDKKSGVVQLPIDRAMDLLLEQGLPKTDAEVPGGAPGDAKEEGKPQ